jgi:hypothetical protein
MRTLVPAERLADVIPALINPPRRSMPFYNTLAADLPRGNAVASRYSQLHSSDAEARAIASVRNLGWPPAGSHAIRARLAYRSALRSRYRIDGAPGATNSRRPSRRSEPTLRPDKRDWLDLRGRG